MSTDKLPNGWTRVKFADIAASVTERVDDPSAAGVDRYVGLEHLDPESTSIRRWGSPSDVESTKLRFYPGDVIYGRRRAYQRKLGVADFDGICSAHALVLRAKPIVCLPEFLPYFLQSETFHQRALDISVGSLSPTINWKTLAVQEFALPPIDEQQRIVDLVDAVDRVAEGLRAVDIKVLWRAVLRQALEQATVECPLGEVLSLEYGKGLSEKNRDGGAYQVVGSAGVVGSHSIPLIKEDSVIVVGRKGTAGSVQLINGPCWPIDTTYYVKLKEELPLTFVAAQLSEIGLDALVAGSAVPGLNRDDAYRLRFRLPDPASIARLVSALARLEAASERVLAERERVRLVRLALLNVSMEDKDVR